MLTKEIQKQLVFNKLLHQKGLFHSKNVDGFKHSVTFFLNRLLHTCQLKNPEKNCFRITK